jgi:peptidoglycan/xylan/chitin deacetylase (PgdA/CDA1 family)
MTRVPDEKRRAVEPYLKFLRLLDDEVELDTRVAHILDEFTAEDFERLSVTLRDFGVTAGFSVPAIHLESRDSLSPAISTLAEDGHEILLHGYRHTSFMDVPYETAHEELSRASSILESVTGSTPAGFHVPYSRASEGTLRAASDLGVELIVGSRADDDTDDDLAVTQPIRPYDIQLLESDLEPAAAFERLGENADESSLLLCHPNVHALHDGAEAFADWLDGRSFATPGDLARDRDDGPGLLLDCFPPFQVA